MADNSKPAFPRQAYSRPGHKGSPPQQGITHREFLISQAMVGLLSNGPIRRGETEDKVVEQAFRMADKALAFQRSERPLLAPVNNELVEWSTKEIVYALEKGQIKGKSGWDDPSRCSTAYLHDLIDEHLERGDDQLVDVAVLCLMIAFRQKVRGYE